MAPVLSKLAEYRYLRFAAYGGTLLLTARLLGLHKTSSSKSTDQDVVFANQSKKNNHDKAGIDRNFLKRIMTILKIMVPGWWTKESGLLLLVATMLIMRTRFDVWMIKNGTSIESSIISRDKNRFLKTLFKYISMQPAIALTNQMLKYGLNSLKLEFRKRFTLHVYEQYLKGYTYYQMSNIDNRIANPDQLLTQDIEKFCNSVVDLYSNISKPLLDIIIYVYGLTHAIGAQGPATMIVYLVISGMILTRMRQPIAKLTVSEQRYEGEFRYVNSRLITNSEEIAFYNGNEKEKSIILHTFKKLYEHLQRFVAFRFRMGIVDDIIAKYTATTCGYLIVSRPFMDLSNERLAKYSYSERLEDYYTSGRMLVRLSQAIGRIVLAGREMTRLSAFTYRVTELMNVTKELNEGHYERTMVTKNDPSKNSSSRELIPGSGKFIKKDYIICFDKVPLVTPNGDVLIKEMSFTVHSGKNVLVCGPNGCGKSSLFRVLGELWPLFGGTVTKPERGKLFYVPQRPYMALGTLRDQVIYPDSKEEMIRKGFSDDQLKEILEKVQLENILVREGGWNSIQDWMDVLSGGEKQRMAMARLFYHKPQFAILDECTSAVSVDVEGFIYQHCRSVGITLFTVSHRKSLWSHHEYYLQMDGRGKYEFKPIEDHTIEYGS